MVLCGVWGGDGLRALMARDRAVDHWLVQEVGPAYDALKANPERAVIAFAVDADVVAIVGVYYGGQDYQSALRWDEVAVE